MKFACGLTKEEKIKIARSKHHAWLRSRIEWHRFFAWYPIQIASNDCRWFEFVERKYEGHLWDLGAGEMSAAVYFDAPKYRAHSK